MTVYTCRDDLEAMLTCIYDAWAGKMGHKNIRLELEPVFQQEMFCDYIHVEADREKAEKVVRSIQKKISFEAWMQVYYAAMSFETGRLDAIYRFLLLGFAYGGKVTDMLAAEPVMELFRLKRKVGNEMHYFREFTRFTSMDGKVYVAHIEPKCNVTAMVAEHFADRMPSEYWMIIDDNRSIAAVHPKDQPFYMTSLTEKELQTLKRTEEQSDIYTELWKEFFRSIGIEARKNPRCQRNLMPLWYRKHATEFMSCVLENGSI